MAAWSCRSNRVVIEKAIAKDWVILVQNWQSPFRRNNILGEFLNMTKDLPIKEDWFAIEPTDENGVRRIIESHVHEWGGGCMWLIEGSEFCLLVETGIGIAPLREFLETVVSKPIIGFASVGYYDHAGGLHQFDQRLIHKADAHRLFQPTRHNTVADYYLDTAFDAKPYKTFDPTTYVMPSSEPTRLLTDGDTIDLFVAALERCGPEVAE